MNFRFVWRHQNGSTVFFDHEGWWSSDLAKSVWLATMHCVANPIPTIPASIREWLDQECRLLEVLGPDASGSVEPRHKTNCRLRADLVEEVSFHPRLPGLPVTA